MPSAIIVTGAAGFIGYHVARRLIERGEHVVGIDCINAYYDPQLKLDRLAELERLGGDFRFSRTDFADADALEGLAAALDFDRIIHLGAQPGVRYSLENPRAYVQSNLVGHLNILELARHTQTRHLVYASSSSVYGQNGKIPFSTGDRMEPPGFTLCGNEKVSLSRELCASVPDSDDRPPVLHGIWPLGAA